MAFRCTSCSAALEPDWADGPLVTCRYCRVAQPSPFGPSNLLLRLDPSSERPAGFTLRLGRPVPGPDGQPELLVDVPPLERALQPSLVSLATFDDFEVRARIRLLYGDVTTTAVGFFFRRTGGNFYAVQLSTIGSVRVLRWTGDQNVVLAPWLGTSSAHTAPGAVNELALRAEGDRLSVRVNGAHACVVRDAAHRAGTISVQSQSEVRHAYAIAALTVEGLQTPTAVAPIAAAGPLGARDVRRGELVFRHAAPGHGVAVTLLVTGTRKIEVIKVIRELTGWGLVPAKEASERLPHLISHAVDGAEAARWASLLRAVGAEVRTG
jgi:ribosomal protein L7/L12